MSWRSPERSAPVALGALCEALWLGALVGVIDAPSWWAAWVGVALVPVAGGVALERWPAGSRLRLPAGLVLIVGLPAVAVVLSRPASLDEGIAELVVAVAFVALAVWLGGRIEWPAPAAALRRAVRCFVSVVAILAVAAAAGRRPVGAEVLVVAAVLVGVGHVAGARAAEAAGAAGSSRRPLVVWTGGVIVAALALLLVASLGALLLTGPLHGPLVWSFAALRYLAAGAGYAIGLIGYAILWAAGAFVALFHLHLPARRPPHLRHLSATPAPHAATHVGGSTLGLGLALLLLLAVLVAVVVVWLLRQRPTRAQERPLEERESLLPTSAAAIRTARRLRDTVVRRVRRAPRPTTPGQAVRHEYRRLESRLARRGFSRPSAASARSFLTRVGDACDDPSARSRAGALVRRYELARYAAVELSWSDADAFRGDGDALLAALARPRASGRA